MWTAGGDGIKIIDGTSNPVGVTLILDNTYKNFLDVISNDTKLHSATLKWNSSGIFEDRRI